MPELTALAERARAEEPNVMPAPLAEIERRASDRHRRKTAFAGALVISLAAVVGIGAVWGIGARRSTDSVTISSEPTTAPTTSAPTLTSIAPATVEPPTTTPEITPETTVAPTTTRPPTTQTTAPRPAPTALPTTTPPTQPTTSVPANLTVSCPNLGFDTPGSEDMATEIKATNVSCGEADTLLRAIRVLDDQTMAQYPSPFAMNGYTCTWASSPPGLGMGYRSYDCSQDDKRVTWKKT